MDQDLGHRLVADNPLREADAYLTSSCRLDPCSRANAAFHDNPEPRELVRGIQYTHHLDFSIWSPWGFGALDPGSNLAADRWGHLEE